MMLSLKRPGTLHSCLIAYSAEHGCKCSHISSSIRKHRWLDGRKSRELPCLNCNVCARCTLCKRWCQMVMSHRNPDRDACRICFTTYHCACLRLHECIEAFLMLVRAVPPYALFRSSKILALFAVLIIWKAACEKKIRARKECILALVCVILAIDYKLVLDVFQDSCCENGALLEGVLKVTIKSTVLCELTEGWSMFYISVPVTNI